MAWGEALEDEIRRLRRVVSILLALAGFAESAAGRSAPVRCFFLWILQPAETAARDYLLELTGRCDVPAWAPALQGEDGGADAMRLAASLRALAVVLAAVLEQAVDALNDALAPVVSTALARAAHRPLAARIALPLPAGRFDSS